MCAGLCSSRCLHVSISVFSHPSPCFTKNRDQEQYFLCIRLLREKVEQGGKQREREWDIQLQALHITEGKVSPKVFNICYKTSLIFNEHTRSYLNGWNSKQRGGVTHLGGVVTNVTWVWHALWKERCIHMPSYWCSGCHGNGPLNKGYVDYYGVTHTQRQASLITYTIFKIIHAYQTHTYKHKYSHSAACTVH